jgi:hypothetical protein
MTAAPMALQRARIADGRLEFDEGCSLRQALRDGCFRLAIPADLDVTPGIRLCREFYRPGSAPASTATTTLLSAPASDDRAYAGFKELDGVYFDRENFQTEHVLADRPARLRHFPAAVVGMCDRMEELAVTVLRASLTELGVAEPLWDEVTGGAAGGHGTQWFAASHYRPERRQPGCAAHKDTGFVAVLYIEQPGLEALVGDRWTSIDAAAGYFVVNFGGAFELLTGSLDLPVQAILHRVRSCEPAPDREDRFSFAAFANPPATGNLYRVRRDMTAEPIVSVEEFLRDFNKNTWNDRYDDFGITGTASDVPAPAPDEGAGRPERVRSG